MEIAAPARTGTDLATREGFSRWIEPHWQAMATLAAGAGRDSDDVLQDALAVAWRKRGQFDPTRGTARNWLLAITADQRRKAWRRATRPLVLGFEAAGAPATPRETTIDIDRAVRRLSTRQQLAIELYYYLGLPTAEVAQVMRCAQGTVMSTLSDARGRLRELLGEDYR